MAKSVTAEYDASENALHFDEPLELRDHDKVEVIVMKPVDPERPWLAFSGILSKEAGDSLARAVEEMFPIDKE